MLRRFSGHLRHQLVAYIALFVALGGTSYAAVSLPAKSVGAKQLKKKAVTSSKIRPNAVTTSKVKNGSLFKDDFAAGQLPAGPQGPRGETGAAGANGATNLTVRQAVGTTTVANANCLPGEVATGGGGRYVSLTARIFNSRPNTPVGDTPTGWHVEGNPGDGVTQLQAYVVCASP